MTRKALGRGLSALLREVETAVPTGLDQIPITLIDPSPNQPRRSFPETGLQELAESIRAGGLIQPILVRRADARYQLIVGERRWRAAQLAGLEAIPAVVRGLSDQEALELGLTENLQREDLNPLDVARAFDLLQQRYHLSHEEIAGRMGLDRSTVTNTLRLLRLAGPVQEMLSNGAITHGHARALLALQSEAAQTTLARLIAKQGLSVRQVEAMVASRQTGTEKAKLRPGDRKLDPNIRAAVLELERVLGTRVKIVGNEKQGTIQIKYYSAEDLNRIYQWVIRS